MRFIGLYGVGGVASIRLNVSSSRVAASSSPEIFLVGVIVITVSISVLDGPLLKVQRANRHIDEIRAMTDPLCPAWYEIVPTYSDVGGPQEHPQCATLIYRPKYPIPQLLAGIIGDAVHNLRCALDHLAAGIIGISPKELGFKPYFPMHPERKNLETDKSLAAIEKALPGANKLLLEDIRPADGPNEASWSFNSLDNLDKHNLIIPTVTVVGIENLNATWGRGGVMARSVAINDAARPFVILETGDPITVGNDFHAAVDIKFGQGTKVFENQSVIPTLFQIRDLVGETLTAFAKLISP